LWAAVRIAGMRFTTRDLFWLMAFVALGLMFLFAVDRLYVDHNAASNLIRHSQNREDELRRAIQAEGYEANWNEERRRYDLTKRP
jgi:hypothetical protein